MRPVTNEHSTAASCSELSRGEAGLREHNLQAAIDGPCCDGVEWPAKPDGPLSWRMVHG